MTSRLCFVLVGDDEWPGTVLSWIRGPEGWRALVRYRALHPSGHMLNYERSLPAEAVRPRS